MDRGLSDSEDTDNIPSYLHNLPRRTAASGRTRKSLRLPAVNPTLLAHAMVGDGVSEADLRQALKVEFESSPISTVETWKSLVLLIHGDDDRTVDFHQTVDLARRLREKHVAVQELVLPDDVHDSLLWRNWNMAVGAAGEFFERTLRLAR